MASSKNVDSFSLKMIPIAFLELLHEQCNTTLKFVWLKKSSFQTAICIPDHLVQSGYNYGQIP